MDDTLKKNLKSESVWLRILYMAIFYLVIQIAIMLIIVLAVAQALFALVTGEPNRNLRQFSSSLNQYFFQVIHFMTFNSDLKPYPFTDWPKAEAEPSDAQDIVNKTRKN